jgi:ribosomal protein L10
MREYGPTPFPAYETAAILGVRAEDVAQVLANLDADQRAEIAGLLQIPVIRLDEVADTDSSTSPEAAAEEPVIDDHSARTSHQFQSLRRQAREKGVL